MTYAFAGYQRFVQGLFKLGAFVRKLLDNSRTKFTEKGFCTMIRTDNHNLPSTTSWKWSMKASPEYYEPILGGKKTKVIMTKIGPKVSERKSTSESIKEFGYWIYYHLRHFLGRNCTNRSCFASDFIVATSYGVSQTSGTGHRSTGKGSRSSRDLL